MTSESRDASCRLADGGGARPWPVVVVVEEEWKSAEPNVMSTGLLMRSSSKDKQSMGCADGPYGLS